MRDSDTLKPHKAFVIACVNSTPHDPLPRPHVIAQPTLGGEYELWNREIAPEARTVDVYEAFAEAYLYCPSDELKFAFMPLARLETPTHLVRVFTANRLLRWQDFLRLDDKELAPLSGSRKIDWNELTQQVVETAFRSKGWRAILKSHRLVQQAQAGTRRGDLRLADAHVH